VTLTRLWAFLAVALPVLAALIANLSAVDLAYQLRAGDQILSGGGIPTADTWTFTAAGAPWADQQWGAQVLLAATYQLAGWTGLVVLRAALIGAIFGLLFLVARRRGLDVRRAAWLTLAAFVVTAVALGLRPQLFGMALFALVLLLVTDRRAHPGRLWLVPVVVAVWANVHGSFFLGPLVVGLAWLEDLHGREPGARRTLLIAVVSAAAACLTPSGPGVWAYAVGLSVNPQVTQRITEWQPTSLRDVPGMLFFGSALIVAVLIARRGRPTPWPTLAWLGVFFVIGAYAIRGVAWWPLAAVAAIAGTIVTAAQRAPDRPERIDPPLIRRLNLVVVGAIVIAGLVLLPAWRPLDPDLGAPTGVVGHAPPGITVTLRDLVRPGDRVFNPQPWGSWFEFALPQASVAIDSRIEVFPVAVWDAYERINDGEDGWERQLDDWDVTIVVAALPKGDAMIGRLTAAGWLEVYRDRDGAVLTRADRVPT
jgi:hypothetical protein